VEFITITFQHEKNTYSIVLDIETTNTTKIRKSDISLMDLLKFYDLRDFWRFCPGLYEPLQVSISLHIQIPAFE